MSPDPEWRPVTGLRSPVSLYAEPTEDEEGDLDPFSPAPCTVCGSAGACAWDAEGLPLIHAKGSESRD